MKIHSFIFSIATASLAATAFARPPVVKYDRFTQTTDLTTQSPHMMQVPRLHTDAIMVTATIEEGKLTTFELDLVTISDQWLYLNCHGVHFLVDDKPYTDLGPGKFVNAMDGRATEEMVVFPLTREQLTTLASAERIEYKICNDEKVFDKEDMAALGDFGPALDKALAGTEMP